MRTGGHPALRLATDVAALMGAAVTAYFMIDNGHPDTPGWWGLFVLFFAWSVSPLVMLTRLVRRHADHPLGAVLLCATAIASVAFGIWALINAFVIHLDPQSGLVFVFLPVWQWAAVGLAAGVSVWLGRRSGTSR